MMTLDEALEHRGPRIAAWDRYRGNVTALRIVAVEEGRATVIARETIPTAAQPDLERRMRERGILIGATYRVCKFVWVFGDQHLEIWKLGDGPQLQGVGRALKVHGEEIAATEVRTVISFYDDADYGHRGVKLGLAAGTEVVVAEEHDPAAELDPTYGMTNLEIDGGWIVHLGRELAARLQVAHRDELSGTETPAPVPREPASDAFVDSLVEAFHAWDEPAQVAKREARADEQNRSDIELLELSYLKSGQCGSDPMDVALTKMAAYFAGRIEQEAPAAGAIEKLYQPLPELENGGYIVLDLKALEGPARALELRVESPSGQRHAAEVVRVGTKAELVGFLRSASVATELIRVMERLTEATRET